MKFIIGEKKEFLDFVNSISKEDNIAIISHTDLDGVASAILLEEILKTKGLLESIKLKKFIDYKKRIFQLILHELKEKKISSVFITDMNPENVDSEGFEAFREKFRVFSIDHHPVGELKDKKGMIKAETEYCSAFICYELGKGILDSEKWKWLANAAAVSDMCHKNPEVLKFIQEDYPEVNRQNIFEFPPGKVSSIINSALIYFDDVKEVYDLIKDKKIRELEKYDREVRKEIGKWVRRYEKEAEFYPEKNLHFYYFNPDFDIKSTLATIISNKKKDAVFVFVSDVKEEPEFVSVSARNQDCREDMNKLMKKGIEGLKNATAGGHVPAAGGRFLKKDLKKFKENILNLIAVQRR